jgi:SAM-dependent methyltransferase
VQLVADHLPRPPRRVLEVGCGAGELARDLAARGYEVVAIDPRAPDGAIFNRVTLEEFDDPEPFDAVIAVKSLHHIEDLDGAVAKLARLLRPGGRILVHEHAWERFDAATAAWYADHGGDAQHWVAHHSDLHSSEAIRAALARHFAERHFGWTPYLHRELGASGLQEQAAIDSGAIRAIGFVYAGDSVAPGQ